ncbi:MAG: circadian clock protein KaiA [Cyanobium sp.]
MPEPALTIACLIRNPALAEVCCQWLGGSRYQVERFDPAADPVVILDRRREDFDAVLLEKGTFEGATSQTLNELGLLLPAVVIGEVTGQVEYHDAEVHLPQDQLEQLGYSLDAALSRFVRRGLLSTGSLSPGNGEGRSDRWKLANRLKGRLSYLGVYYKRDPDRFLRNLPATKREELLRSLTRTYRDLLLSYFRDPAAANQAIESYVNTAFFIDLPITQTVEIHMNLIEGFWKQLSLEGHKQDFLQDYRLALLDVMAHLCEMYRHSIPPDAPLTFTPSTPEPRRPSGLSRSVTTLRSTELN